MKFSFSAILTLLLPLALTAQTVFECDFKGTPEAMKAQGWVVPSKGAEQTPEGMKITGFGDRNTFMYDFPVETGISYGGTIKIKSLNVSMAQTRSRGATFYFGFLSKDKAWINGGEFPVGLTGATNIWQTLAIPRTRPIPPEVKYIQIFVCVEDTGSAIFKDFEMHKVDLSSTFTVDTTANPPAFSFSKPPLQGSVDIGLLKARFRLLLSQKPDFPEDATFEHLLPEEPLTFKLPYALKPGKWYAKGNWSTNCIFPDLKLSFEIQNLPADAPVTVIPHFKNGSYIPEPSLAFTVYPHMPKSISATANGKPMSVSFPKVLDGDAIALKPHEKMAPGTYDIQITADGKKFTFVFVNKKPAHTYSYRDDNMLILDGKPFFPIGTYRDPSGERMVFDGIKEAGFNLTHSYFFENYDSTEEDIVSYLQACQKANVLAFLGTKHSIIIGDQKEKLQHHYGAMVDQPGLLGFYVADEPDGCLNIFSVKNAAKNIKECCPTIPRIILLCNPTAELPNVQEFGNGSCSEILSHDCYPLPANGVKTVQEEMQVMRKVSRGKQPLWCVVQCFDWDQYKVQKKKPEDVEPKAGGIRCMTHMALTADVQGIVFYWLPNDRYIFKKHAPIQWAETVATTHELNSLYKYLIGRNAPQAFKHPESVEYWCRQAEDGSYALGLVNSTKETVTFQLDVLNFHKSVTLPPYGVEVLRQK